MAISELKDAINWHWEIVNIEHFPCGWCCAQHCTGLHARHMEVGFPVQGPQSACGRTCLSTLCAITLETCTAKTPWKEFQSLLLSACVIGWAGLCMQGASVIAMVTGSRLGDWRPLCVVVMQSGSGSLVHV